jgi:AcrR family transcriptional regulator
VELFLARGFRRFTLDDIAAELSCSKRTLYALADSKEQLATLVVREFFRRATAQVEATIARTRSPGRRLTGYLEAVADALAPASRTFTDDVASFPPAREIYDRNTEAAAVRVRDLIEEGCDSGAFRSVDTTFVAEVVTASMRRITSGELTAATGLSDAEAYHQLAKLVLAAVQR